MSNLRMMRVVFNTPLRHSEIRFFRGAVIKYAGQDNMLFHNHEGEGFRYKYPMIQYRITGGKAAIVCFNEGIEQMQAPFASGFIGSEIIIGGDNRGEISIESITQNEYFLQGLDEPIHYHISRWIPLNQQNYNLWQQIETEDEKVAKLQSVLIGNIISFAKGIGWQISNKIECEIITESISTRPTKYKEQSLISFSLDFAVNLFVPTGVGLGKGVSANCGVVTRCRDEYQAH